PGGRLRVPSPVAPYPATDHRAPPVVARAASAARVEALGHAVELGPPRDVLLEALFGLPGDADPMPSGLLAEARDAAGRCALLLLRSRTEVDLRPRADDHDLVVLDRSLYPREP